MEKKTKKEFRINIDVSDGKIRLGRNHAVAAFTDEVISWACKDYLFAVQFPPGTPFTVENTGNSSIMRKQKNVIPYLPYKYTIAVYDKKNQKVLILDPVYVDVPPRG